MATRSLTLKDARLDLRMNAEQKETIARAAAASGMSVSQWALDRLMSSARSDLIDVQTLRMAAREFDTFARLLEEPQEPAFAAFISEKTPWEE